MKKTIAIPTDFSVESLNVLKTLLSQNNNRDQYDVILLHGTQLTDSITELIFMSKAKLTEKLSNPAFEEACTVIRNKFSSQINSIRKDFFTGFTQTAFDNYLEGNKITDIYVSKHRSPRFTHKKSFDILPYAYKSPATVHEVDFKVDTVLPEKGKVAEVFYNSLATH